MNHEWRLLVLSLLLVAVRGEKIGILLSTLSNSQILFGTQLAEVLRSDQHEVVLIRPQLNPEANWKSGEFREIRIDALGGQPAVFHDFYAMEQEIIFGRAALLRSPLRSVRGCFPAADERLVHRQENFDLIYAWLSPFTDRMTYWERAVNLLISLAETSEDYSIRKLDVLYRQHFGPDFPSRPAELFNYPRLTSHKIVYIGGLGQEEDGETGVKLDQEYSKFIGDHPIVLVSLGSVANSTQMPQEWKEEFVKTLSESLYAAVPTVLLPLFADQARNANLAKVRGVGVVVKKGEMRAEVLAERIAEVLSNSSYSTAARKVQRLLRNKPFKASEQIVRWNRFLLTNTVDLNVVSLGFFEFYSLDVLLPLVFLPSLLLLWIFYRLLRLYWWSCFGMQKRSSHLKRE
ncbi:Glucuronosyltransferase [Aphelenchoides fujianensis]|nr:Glucuronosyltransferase [Aphelenchoides fujianensis]